MTRPKQYDKRTSTGIRFDTNLHDGLVVAAAARDISVNQLVNNGMRFYLERLIPADEVVWTKEDTDE